MAELTSCRKMLHLLSMVSNEMLLGAAYGAHRVIGDSLRSFLRILRRLDQLRPS